MLEIHPIRFSAIETRLGWQGCRNSHLAILELCGCESSFLILEDDVMFLSDYYSNYLNAISELPFDWDMLSLGASPQESFERYSDHLFKMGKALCAHAILWHNRNGGAVEYILSHKNDIKKIDVFFAEQIYKNFNCYLIYPLLCTQKQFPSDTCIKSDVSIIQKNYLKFVK
jgi:GR25 family glycosyltransferase involved in LPS biosynthesis